MTHVVAGNNEGFENLLQRFNKKVQQDGGLSEIRRHKFFEKPCVRRKEAAKRRKTARTSVK